MERYELGRYGYLEHCVFGQPVSRLLRLSVVNDTAGFFFFVGFEADTVGGLPWHSDLVLDCCALDDPHHEVVIEDSPVFESEVGWLFEGERSGDGYAVPIVEGLLEELSLCSF